MTSRQRTAARAYIAAVNEWRRALKRARRLARAQAYDEALRLSNRALRIARDGGLLTVAEDRRFRALGRRAA